MQEKWIIRLIALLLLPALFWNLGEMVFIDDEAIRALVAQEMEWSGNYLVPTMHGDAYFNKPPLWNWILVLSFRLWGGASEWSARFPTVICLLGYATTTYYLSKAYLGKRDALLAALMIITCGRMLFWDSMLALIDVCFSWVIFTQFLLLYRFGQRQDWWRALGWTYLLTAVAFMLKGLPAIVFQGITLVAYLIWRGEWRQLFRPAHILSGLGCLALLACYYLPYSQQVPFEHVWERLFSESSKRTALEHSIWETFGHLINFPLEMTYHFLPWTLLLVFFIRKDLRRRLADQPFTRYLLLVFFVNIPIYWLSPNVYPRYLLMLYPLLFMAAVGLHEEQRLEDSWNYKFFYYLFLGIIGIISLAMIFIPLIPETGILPYRWPLAIICTSAGLTITYYYWRQQAQGLLLLVAFMLLLRILINGFVLPPRAVSDVKGQAVKATAERVGNNPELRPLAIYGWSTIEPTTGYYLELAYGGLVRRHVFELDSSAYYIVSPRQYPAATGVASPDSLFLRHDHRPYYRLIDLRKYKIEIPNTAATNADGSGSGIKIE
ncbi:MAG: glycosyltransferase family 39 protein [Bacteroidota bacterium]